MTGRDWFWVPGQEPPGVNGDLMAAWCQAVLLTPGLTGPEVKATMAKLVRHLSGGKQKVVDDMTLKDDLAALAARDAQRPEISYDLSTLRTRAAEAYNDSADARRAAWSRYHHALQAMYERGELVPVGRGVAPHVAPDVLFTDGRHVVMIGQVPDQFVRYAREDRRFDPVRPARPDLVDKLWGLAQSMRSADEVSDYNRGYYDALEAVTEMLR